MPEFKDILQNGLIKSATTNTRTLDVVQHFSDQFHSKFNKLAQNIAAIDGDKSRTKSEKSSLLQKTHNKASNELGDILVKIGDSIHDHREAYNLESERVLAGGDRLARLHLATHLKDNKTNLHELVKEDVRYLQASSEFPASYFGEKAENMAKLQQLATHKHIPELKTLDDKLNASEGHLGLIIKYMDTLTDGTLNMVDSEAMATRFDETNI